MVTVISAPSSDPTIHLSTIDVALFKRGGKYNIKGLATIVDENGNPVKGATVTGTWTYGDMTKQLSDETNKKGVASLDYGTVLAQSGDIFNLIVTNVSKEGFTYIPPIETSDEEMVP